MASLSEVAKEAGVSITTASMVLNNGKRAQRISAASAARIREAAARLGYVPNYLARSMKLGRAEVLGVALDIPAHNAQGGLAQPDLAIGYFGRLIGAAELAARGAGFALSVIGPDERLSAIRRGIQAIRQRRIDGAIVFGSLSHIQLHAMLAEPLDEPLVVLEYSGPNPIPAINWDEVAGVRLAVGHLAELGHRDLLYIGPEALDPAQASVVREQAFMRCVWDAGLRGAICHVPAGGAGQVNPQEALVDGTAGVLGSYLRQTERRPFSAIVCYSDLLAIGVYTALAGAGLRVPGDISVVGFDDLQAPFLIPKLTSVDHMLQEMGTRATEILLELIRSPERRGEYRHYREVLGPRLVARQSTGPAPAR